MAVSNDQIIVLNDKRLTKIIFLTVLAALGISFIALWYTRSISSVVEDIGIVRELEKTQYNQQLYLNLTAKLDSVQTRMDSIQTESERILRARMDTAAANRADYVRIQRRTDSIIAYETKIRAAQVEELKRKGLWK